MMHKRDEAQKRIPRIKCVKLFSYIILYFACWMKGLDESIKLQRDNNNEIVGGCVVEETGSYYKQETKNNHTMNKVKQVLLRVTNKSKLLRSWYILKDV